MLVMCDRLRFLSRSDESQKQEKGEIWIVEIDGAIKAGMEFDLADRLENCMHKSEVQKSL